MEYEPDQAGHTEKAEDWIHSNEWDFVSDFK